MKKHSINKISNDVCQFLVVYDKSTVYDMITNFKMHDVSFDLVDLVDISLKEFFERDIIIATVIEKIICMQLQSMISFSLSFDSIGKIEVIDETVDDITFVLTETIYDESVKLKFPKMSDLELKRTELNDDDFDAIISEILDANGYYETISVDACEFGECDIYLNIKGKDVIISSVLDKEQLLEYAMSIADDDIVRVKDSVKVKNKLLKKGNIIYTISKIEKHIPVSFTDEIAIKLNYCNCKTAQEFKETYLKNLNKVNSLYDVVNAIKDRLEEMNDFHISKECLNLYKNSIMFISSSDEQTYNAIKSLRLPHYINKELEGKSIDTFLLEGIVKIQYQIDKLMKIPNIGTYQDYLKKFENDLKLYMYVKKL